MDLSGRPRTCYDASPAACDFFPLRLHDPCPRRWGLVLLGFAGRYFRRLCRDGGDGVAFSFRKGCAVPMFQTGIDRTTSIAVFEQGGEEYFPYDCQLGPCRDFGPP